ncbi:cryptochrome/photolyase family protein [Natrarchaeobaculum sulfurireducens]|uniref:Deoxyribodipyrimidine photolyase n=1 Tax=Natrarchaeobaculum sulfurireducens TaxID=2044521 RepID=A0A346PQZ3_9EURY|nr:deoxyribodipyrimidine photo-lyase [Natrarchaeobaculum sulfurireducens]AXR81938.1 Deoxyribodipyrimidine photolyase [Natrarchaeobaculum sulfurireducens]
MVLFWHRRDLRVRDNCGLEQAASFDEPLVSLFVLDPTVLEHASPVRVACLLDGLSALREQYRERDSDLLVRRGEASEVVPQVASEVEASTVVWNEDYSGLASERDRAVTAALEDDGVRLESVHDAICHEPGSITPNQGEHYSVFSYFWKKWRDREKQSPVDAPTAADLGEVRGDPLPSLEELGFEEPEVSFPSVTPTAARERVASFCSGPIYRYAETRDVPSAGMTSRLSPHLKWGTVGVRELYAATERAADRAEDGDARASVREFQRQLAWREFYAHVLAFNPETVSENFSGYQNGIEWHNDPEELEAWQAGRTGYPIVDAGMRQLLEEAWMHNRVRMLVASFLTKDLLIDWREGYDWFRRHLADHETANDVGGWQWAASTGTDAQPYFRVFNPMKQGREYDPDAEYIRQYVPELADASSDEIHGWHELEPSEREAVAPDYPAPLVDHGERRTMAIETFERARGDG